MGIPGRGSRVDKGRSMKEHWGFHCCSCYSSGSWVVDSSGLNVYVPQHVYVEIPVPKAMVLGGGPPEAIRS